MAGRFQSEFDPDELNKITHRGLQSLSRSQFEEKQTSEEVSTLKTRQRAEDTFIVKLTRFFARIVDGFASAFKGLFAKPAKKVTQCDNYGHALKPGWTGDRPLCMDCGQAITSLDQVRGAVPRDTKKDVQNPYPNKDRKYVK
jgi:hypothetical protein